MASGDGLSMTVHRDSVQWGLDNGKIDRARAEAEMKLEGNTLPLAEPKVATPAELAPEGSDVETLPGFEPASKISDYQIPDVSELHKVFTAGKDGALGAGLTSAEVMQTQQEVGGWLQAGRFPGVIGSAVSKIAGQHMADMPRYADMPVQAQEAYRITEQSKLDRLWGNQAPGNISLARKLVSEIEAKQPGLVAFLERSGLANNSQVVAQIAAQARRLYSKAK